MKILIYGAGVIGSLYAVRFCNAGYDVFVYARGQRLNELCRIGLLYKKKNKIEAAAINIIKTINSNDFYDFILLTVREEHLKEALCNLKEISCRAIITMVNTVCPYSELEALCGKGKLLPAFPGAGGSIDGGVLDADLTPRLIQPTSLGEIDGKKTERLRIFVKILKKSGIPCKIISDMYKWQITHLGLVVPLAAAYYMTDEPSTVYKNKEIMKVTARTLQNNFRVLAKIGVLTPFKFYIITLCPKFLINLILRFLFKSSFGNKFMYRHAMKAVDEMTKLANDFERIIKRFDKLSL